MRQARHFNLQGTVRRLLPAAWLIACCLVALDTAAQPTLQTVDRIKAAYIYNFAKFMEWPIADDKAIRLCVLGKDDLNGAVLGLQRRVAQGREIAVRKDVPLEQIRDCSIVFVGETEARLLGMAVRQLGNAPVLLVSDTRQAVDQGAHLALVFNEDRVEFDVNLQHLQKSGIKASSQMLRLARSVVR